LRRPLYESAGFGDLTQSVVPVIQRKIGLFGFDIVNMAGTALKALKGYAYRRVHINFYCAGFLLQGIDVYFFRVFVPFFRQIVTQIEAKRGVKPIYIV
jgi:hypothetical protein